MAGRLTYGISTRFGRAIAECVDDLITTRARIQRISAAFDSMTYGSPANWAKLEAELQLGAGEGPDMYALVNAIKTELEQLPELGRIDQGARS